MGLTWLLANTLFGGEGGSSLKSFFTGEKMRLYREKKKYFSLIGIDLFIQLLTALLSNKSMTIIMFQTFKHTVFVDSLFIKIIF